MSALASVVEDANTAVHLRNYDIGVTVPSEYTGWSIWEAARATSAAPVYFKRFTKDGKEFVDGGLGWNNPIYEWVPSRPTGITHTDNEWRLIAELPALYGKGFNIGCIVSLGTGIPPKLKLGSGIMSTRDFIAIATNSEVPHNQLRRSATLLPRQDEEKYWRLNMSKAMSEHDWVEKIVSTWLGLKKEVKKMTYEDIMVKMDDWEAIDMIRELTDKWLEHTDTKKLLNECAARIAMKDKA
jgi:predicted acylesterase/phospholipase RssA